MANILKTLNNPKARIFLIFLGVLILGGGFVALRSMDKDTKIATQETVVKTAPPPQGLESGIGEETSKEMEDLLSKENIKKAEEATKKGTSAIDTIIAQTQDNETDNQASGARSEGDNPFGGIASSGTGSYGTGNIANQQSSLFGPDAQGGQFGPDAQGGQFGPGAQGGQFGPGAQSGPLGARGQVDRAELERLKRENIEQENREREARERKELARQQEIQRLRNIEQAEVQAYQQKVQQRTQQMQNYANAVYTDWGSTPTQAYIAGVFAPAKKTEIKSGNTKVQIVEKEGKEVVIQEQIPQKSTEKGPKKQIIKAGTIFYGVLDTGINSDEPSPVLATIVHGKLKGGKLIGNVTVPQNGEKVVLNFQTLSLPNYDNSLGVSAVAIDSNTARTALASDVDHHYLLRYGSLFASSFLEGYGKVIAEQGTTTISATDGSTVTSSKPILSTKDQYKAALGTVGQEFTNVLRPLFDTPTTITVDAGTGLGILFLSDTDVTPKKG